MVAFIYRLFGKKMPYYAKYSVWFMLWKIIRKFINVVVVPNIPFNKVRILLYRVVGYSIGKNVFIGMKCYLDDMEPKLITICDNVTISYCVKFAIHGKNQNHTEIHIKEGVYIGLGAIILSGKKGITIYENAVIGAGSVVTSSIPSNSVAVGNPAKVIRQAQ